MNIKKIKKIKPLFCGIITTADKEDEENSKIILLNKNSGNVSLYQKVLFASENNSRGIKAGDIVHINPINYAKRKYKEGTLQDGVVEQNFTVSFEIPRIDINDKMCLFLQDRDIDYIVEEYE